jgi:magnesium transporter
MTRLFEATQAGLVEQKRDPVRGFSVEDQCVRWFVVYPDEQGWDLRKADLPFDEATLAWIASCDQRPTFRIKFNLGLVDFALHNPSSREQSDYFRLIVGRNLLVTIVPAGSTMVQSVLDAVGDIASHEKPVAEGVLYNVVNAIIAVHAEDAANLRRFVNDLAVKVDSENAKIEVKEFLEAKMRLDRLTRVLEEQSITLGFSPHVWWEDRSDRMRQEFANLRLALQSLESSMDNMRNRLDAIHHHYLLVLQEASNKRLNVLTIVQAIFVPLTFIAGMYGMNFVYIPALNWQYGYFLVLGFMVLITAFSLRYFHKHGWFD